MQYTYGTTEDAAKRLEEVAQFFNPYSSEYIKEHVAGSIQATLDLGCGPGFSTDMLYTVIDCPSFYGMDNSPEFVEAAADKFNHCTFVLHDVTRTPFPIRGEIAYVRFLLSHLKDPIWLINRWITQLLDGGKLIIEELEYVDTDQPVFQQYLKINRALIASKGASLYVGSMLGAGNYNAHVSYNECITIPVASYQAATWFLPNVRTVWEREEYILDNVSSSRRRGIAMELQRIKETHDLSIENTWHLRRLVLERK